MLIQIQHPDVLNNFHSPWIGLYWSTLGAIFGQPLGALAAQTLLILAYPAFLVVTLSGVARFLAVLLTVALVSTGGLIIKDAVISALMMMLLLFIHAGMSRWLLVPPVVFILFCRPSNFLVLGVAATFVAFASVRRPMGALVAIWALALLSIPVLSAVERLLLAPADKSPEQSLIVFDVAGISSSIGTDLFKSLQGWPSDLPPPWQCYTPEAWDPFRWGKCASYAEEGGPFEKAIATQGKRGIVAWWLGIIAQHPVAYLKHRLMHFRSTVFDAGIIESVYGASNRAGADVSGITTYGYDMRSSFQQWTPTTLAKGLNWVARSIFNGWVLCAVLLTSLVITMRQIWRPSPPFTQSVAMIAAAALCLGNAAMYLVFGVASQARYMMPSVVCGVIAASLALSITAPRKPRL